MSTHVSRRRTWVTVVGAVAAVGLPAGAMTAPATATAGPASAAETAAYGYVWANQPTAASYTPSSSYSKNSTGATNSVVRNSTGDYTVTFPGLADVGGGTVDVTGYDTSGYCKVADWVPSGSALDANVLCFAAGGAPRDSYFDAVFAAATSTPSNHLSYLWADEPTTSSYTPSPSYQYNSGGGTDTIVRNGTGNYSVAIPGIGVNAGTVKVTGYSTNKTDCRIGSWAGTPTLEVNVLCTNAAGNPANAYFSMTWANKGSLLAQSGGKWGYVWADSPTSASYTPSTSYQGNSSRAVDTITRSGTGAYEVDFPNLVGAQGDVQVSAYSTDAACSSAGWDSDGSGGAAVYVDCYSPTGAPVDSYFTAQYDL